MMSVLWDSALDILHTERTVNCKSEGNVLGVEKEPKGDAHFCK